MLFFRLFLDCLTPKSWRINITKNIKYSTAIYNTNNNNKCFLSTNQYVRMISEGSCDTEDRVMMLEIQLCITEINYILKYIQIENSSFKF